MAVEFRQVDFMQEGALADPTIIALVRALWNRRFFRTLATMLKDQQAWAQSVQALLRQCGTDASLEDLLPLATAVEEMLHNMPAWLAQEQNPNGAVRGAIFEGFCRRWSATKWRPGLPLAYGCAAYLDGAVLRGGRTVDVGYARESVGFGEFKVSTWWFRQRRTFAFLRDLKRATTHPDTGEPTVIALSLDFASEVVQEAVQQGYEGVQVYGYRELLDSVEGRRVIPVVARRSPPRRVSGPTSRRSIRRTRRH